MSVSVYIIGETTDDLLEWNVSNDNFRGIMDLLGRNDIATEDGPIGVFEVSTLPQLRADVQFALDSIKALPALDAGGAAFEDGIPGKCRVIQCGHMPGYFEYRLTGLLAIIDRAQAAGLPVRYS